MQIHFHTTTIAEITADGIIIHNAQDALELMMNCSYQGADSVVLYQQHIVPDFFELKTGIAGEVLQKFSNYRMRMAIVGDFSAMSSSSLRDFIYESNKGRLINFVASLEEALERLAK